MALRLGYVCSLIPNNTSVFSHLTETLGNSLALQIHSVSRILCALTIMNFNSILHTIDDEIISLLSLQNLWSWWNILINLGASFPAGLCTLLDSNTDHH